MNFYMTIGAPGAGKSTITETLECNTYSLDLGRETLCGTRQCWDKEPEVRDWVKSNIERELREGKDVCYDATNINPKSRKPWISWIKSLGIKCNIIALYLDTPKEEVIRRNHTRPEEHRVPDDVVESFFQRLEPPTLKEGFDEIRVF